MKKTKLLPTAVLAVLILVLGVLTVKRATLPELEVALPIPSPAPAPTEEPAPVFEERDFKKKDGFLDSVRLAKAYGLYRQDYCGCRFSRAARDARAASRKD